MTHWEAIIYEHELLRNNTAISEALDKSPLFAVRWWALEPAGYAGSGPKIR